MRQRDIDLLEMRTGSGKYVMSGPFSLTEVGRGYGVTRQRVHQLERRAIINLLRHYARTKEKEPEEQHEGHQPGPQGASVQEGPTKQLPFPEEQTHSVEEDRRED